MEDAVHVLPKRNAVQALEDRLMSRISRLKLACDQSDHAKDITFADLEARVVEVKGWHWKVERQVADLTGNFEELSNEMQAQTSRCHSLVVRVQECSRYMEESRVRHIKTMDLTRAESNRTSHALKQLGAEMETQERRLEEALKRLTDRLDAQEHRLKECGTDVAGMQALERLGAGLTAHERRLEEAVEWLTERLGTQERRLEESTVSLASVRDDRGEALQHLTNRLDAQEHRLEESATSAATMQETLARLSDWSGVQEQRFEEALEQLTDQLHGLEPRLEKSATGAATMQEALGRVTSRLGEQRLEKVLEQLADRLGAQERRLQEAAREAARAHDEFNQRIEQNQRAVATWARDAKQADADTKEEFYERMQGLQDRLSSLDDKLESERSARGGMHQHILQMVAETSEKQREPVETLQHRLPDVFQGTLSTNRGMHVEAQERMGVRLEAHESQVEEDLILGLILAAVRGLPTYTARCRA